MTTLRGMKKSWVIWFNGVLIAALPMFEMTILVLPQLQEFLPENMYKIVGLIAVVGNLLLRFKTTSSLKDRGNAKSNRSGSV